MTAITVEGDAAQGYLKDLLGRVSKAQQAPKPPGGIIGLGAVVINENLAVMIIPCSDACVECQLRQVVWRPEAGVPLDRPQRTSEVPGAV